MKQVFLYKRSASLLKSDLDALREAGFVPIRVTEFDEVKVIDPISIASRTEVWMAAMKAIANANTDQARGEGPKTLFGRYLSEKLAECSIADVEPKK